MKYLNNDLFIVYKIIKLFFPTRTFPAWSILFFGNKHLADLCELSGPGFDVGLPTVAAIFYFFGYAWTQSDQM